MGEREDEGGGGGSVEFDQVAVERGTGRRATRTESESDGRGERTAMMKANWRRPATERATLK